MIFDDSTGNRVSSRGIKGIYEEIQKAREPKREKSVVEEQMIQGFKGWEKASEEERNDICLWLALEIEDLETVEG